jgi:Tol biopolymer transport system component
LNKPKNIVFLLVILFTLIGCQQAPMTNATLSPATVVPPTAEPPTASATVVPSFTPTYTSSPTSTLTPTHTRTPTPTKTYTPTPTPLGGGSGQIAFSSQAGIDLLDVSTGIRQPLGGYGSWLQWYEDGKALAYLHFSHQGVQGDQRLCIYQFYSETEKCLRIESTHSSMPFSVSPVSRTIALSSTIEGIYLMDILKGTQKVITEGENATWSPDGTQIAFTKEGRVYIMNSDGSDPKMIISSSGNSELIWSPRGDRIAYVAWKNGNGDVYTTTLEGMQTRHSFSSNYDGYPAWSADGTRLAYITAYSMSYAGLYGDVVVVDFETNTSQQITNAIGATSSAPSWSPDGQWLTFGACKTSQAEATCAVMVVSVDGTNMEPLTNYDKTEYRPVWRP